MMLFIRMSSEAFEECDWSLPYYTMADRVRMYSVTASMMRSTSYVLIGVF